MGAEQGTGVRVGSGQQGEPGSGRGWGRVQTSVCRAREGRVAEKPRPRGSELGKSTTGPERSNGSGLGPPSSDGLDPELGLWVRVRSGGRGQGWG